jgi:3-oxoacyl-[acyl-carrier protein] reductase
MLNLDGKTVIVTGASRGIGREIALAFAREKANLSLWFEKNAAYTEKAAELSCASGVKAISLQADVKSEKAVLSAVEKTLTEFGEISVLINNAGVSLPDFIQNSKDSDWDTSIAVNLTGVFLCSKAVIPSMLHNDGGHIINISSIAAIRGVKGGSAYAASKTGVIALTQTIAKEYGKKNIRANCVFPGFHKTDMTANLSEDIVSRTIAHNVLGRSTTLDEVSAFVVFLAKTENISGQVFNLDSRIKKEF